jgi:hypothetical protein
MTPEVYSAGTGWRSLTGAQQPRRLRPRLPARLLPARLGRPERPGVRHLGRDHVVPRRRRQRRRRFGARGRPFKTPASSTAPVNVGATNTAVMFAPGRVLQVGGNGYFNGDGLPASNMATVVDINGANPVLSETARDDLRAPLPQRGGAARRQGARHRRHARGQQRRRRCGLCRRDLEPGDRHLDRRRERRADPRLPLGHAADAQRHGAVHRRRCARPGEQPER